MKSNFVWFKVAISFIFAFINIQSNVLAQNPNLLYGATFRGGLYGSGVIFHLDKTTALQSVDYSFPILIPGKCPAGNLTYVGNGKFYGMTTDGGANSEGIIFEWDSATNIISKKFDFGSTNGGLPYGSLTFYNNKLYGMTSQGIGAGIFEWDPSTNIFTKKIVLNTLIGSDPYGSLVLYAGKFYGMTSYGGINGMGVIFEWDPASNIYTKKIDFDFYTTGNRPRGSLTFYNGKFYGMTQNGGSSGNGVIFEWDPYTNIYSKKMDFESYQGSNPYGSLTLNNGKFYGMTIRGGLYNDGVIFEWDPLTNVYSKKIDFDGISKGGTPYGDLTLFNGEFYGMTCNGGSNDKGVFFKWDLATNSFSKLSEFDGESHGSNPWGMVIAHYGKLYGMTFTGGKVNSGVLFEWDTASSNLTKKADFSMSEFGGIVYGSLTLYNGRFYGMTYEGGSNGKGVIFEWNPLTSSFLKKAEFNGTGNGANPYGSLMVANGKFYGMTYAGGEFNQGVIFEWDPATNFIIKRIDFDGTDKGSNPYGSLVFNNGLFYGMASKGGVYDNGVIFEWNPIVNVFYKKVDFNTTTTGSNPHSELCMFNGKFYGMTRLGGVNNVGVIFEWDPVSNTFNKKIDFNSYPKGANPSGSLNMLNGKLYGSTYYGGSQDKGVIFEWDPSTNLFIKRIDLNWENGAFPKGSLTLNNGKFYGLTEQGANFAVGVIFEWDPSFVNTYTKLSEFNVINGSWPKYTRLTVFNDSTTAAQATNIYFTDVQNTQMNINWVDGSGDKRAVFIKQGSDGTAAPFNNNTYVANTTFGSGTQIGTTGWYCVFNGTTHNSGVTVTNLLYNTAYRVMVCEYTGTIGFEQYNDTVADGNPVNQTIGTFYTVTTTSSPSAGGTTSGGGPYLSGTQATVNATPNTGYYFVNWIENSNVVSTSAGYTFVVTANRNLVASFAPQQYIIATSSNPIAGGTTSGGGTYNFGNTATVTATASSTWTFLNWTENGNVVSTTPAYSFTVSASRTLVANFTQGPTFLITTASAPVSGGTTSGGGNYYSGQPATVTATANAGFNFANWTENGNIVSPSASYTFTVNVARSLVANFVLQQLSITTASDPPSGGTTTGGGTFTYGNQATVTATANSNFTFSYWLENGSVVATTPQYSFTVTASSLLVANFEPDPTYLITTYSAPAYGGTTSGGGSFLAGQSATIIATPNTGYDFANWSENGNVVSTEVSYTFTVTGARVLTANFVLQQFTVTTSPNPPAGGTTDGDGTYNYGAQVTLNATANTNWTFLNWTENGSVVSTLPEYVFIVNTNQSFVANFTQSPTYQVTTSSSPAEGGNTSGGGNYIAGQMATVSAISNTGYSFTNWTLSGNVVSTDSVYSFSVTTNTDLVANFDPADFFISATAIPAGSGTISGGGMYPYGSTAIVTASSGKSWVFYEWTENCNPVSVSASYSFVVTSPRDLAAVFYQPGIQFVTSTIAQPLEGGYVTGCGTYYIDSIATVQAIPYPGWEFVNWSENGMPVSTNSSYSYPVTDHRSIAANFRLYTGIAEPQPYLVRVFPNPAKNELFLEWDNSAIPEIDEVILYNSLSQIVYSQRLEGTIGRHAINVEGFTSGVYYLKVSSKGLKVSDYKIVVHH